MKIKTDEEILREIEKTGKIVFYKSNYGLPLGKWDRFINWLWYWAGERNKLWAKIPFYTLHWLEQRSYDLSCLIGKHFYINSETECERCGKINLV
jgi:hypothetical protein